MGLQALSTRLNALLDAHKLTQQSIYRLSKLISNSSNGSNGYGNSPSNSFNLSSSTRSFAPGAATDEVRQELVSDIHESLKQQEEDLELLLQEIDEVFEAGGLGGSSGRRRNSERERERARVAAQAARLGEDLRHARVLFRNAQLSAKRAAEAVKQRERALLCASLQHSPATDNTDSNHNSSENPTASDGSIHTNPTLNHIPRRRGPEKLSSDPDAIVADASSDVVAALRRSHALLSTELSRSRFAQETLDQSGRALADLSEKYSSVNDLLGTSKALVGELLRSQKSDSWYLQTALYLLIGTLGWLIFRRFLWGPIWLLFWLPVRTGFALLGWILGLVGLGFDFGGKATESSAVAAALSSSNFASASASTAIISTSTSLIVKPSATDRPPARRDPAGSNWPSVRVGMGGGKGADQQHDQQHDQKGETRGKDVGNLVDEVGDMIDESENDGGHGTSSPRQGEGEGTEEEKPGDGDRNKPQSVEYRGDGQPLVQSDAPRNSKKRMMEEPLDAKEKDEL